MSFQFTREGTVYFVHTEVGAGAARVVVEEQQSQLAAQSLEPTEEDAHA